MHAQITSAYGIQLGTLSGGQNITISNASNVGNQLEIWRIPAPGEWWDLVGEWSVSTADGSTFYGTGGCYSPQSGFSYDGYSLTITNLPPGHYEVLIADGGGYPHTNWFGYWSDGSGYIGYNGSGGAHSRFNVLVTTPTTEPPVTLGHINIPVSTWSTSGSAYSQVNFSINDNGAVSGSYRYTHHQPGDDPYLTYQIFDLYGGPGYAIWTVRVNHGGPVGSTPYYRVAMMIALYKRATRSWAVSEVKGYSASYNISYTYRSADIGPVGDLLPHQFNYQSTLQDQGYNISYPIGLYSIPTQPL